MRKLNTLMIGTCATLGVTCILSSVAMTKAAYKNEMNKVKKVTVTQKRVANCKSNEIKLADINLEVGTNLSVNPKDYLTTPTDIETSILKKLKLDTSNVNVGQVGNYIYKIVLNNKVYNGNVIVNAKPAPPIENLTLKSFSLEVGSILSNDASVYIQETLTPEALATVVLNTSSVDINTPGTYQYSIAFNGKLYTNNITIYEPQYGASNVNSNVVEDNSATLLENPTIG